MQHYSELISTLSTLELPVIKDNKKVQYINIECGFDIETTSHKIDGEKVSFMYVWMIGIGYGKPTYYGRTWAEFVDLCNHLSSSLELNENMRLVVYVHNLGYEFQFMRKYFEWVDVFSASERKPIRALTNLGIEFRDSYILSGYSLENTAKNLVKFKIKKMVGDLDYSLIRTYKTELTDLEIKYCINDIQIILAYINEQIEYCGDIAKIPMTNTGRVRKYVRNNCYYLTQDGEKAGKGHYIRYRKIMEDLTLDLPTYVQLKRAFMGGFTHANSMYSGKLLHDVTSVDFTSSYPSVMVSEKFPMSRFKPVEVTSIAHLNTLCSKFAVIMDIKFSNIKAKITQENYISESKCREIVKAVINNGRISSAESITLTLTEIDYGIMTQCYSWDDISVQNVKYANKDYLPKSIVSSILRLYQDKTELKDVKGSEVEYLLSKGMLNSIYGMCVTDVIKPQSKYDGDDWSVEMPDHVEELDKYNTSRNRFLYYAWGIYVTAYARKNLWTGIIATGEDYVYSDTDSLKLLNYEKHKPYIEWFNKQIIAKMYAMCDHFDFDPSLLNPKTKKGINKMLGVWDYEGTYKNFKTLGAKRYLVQDGDDLFITVAGLSKQKGLEYMLSESGNDKLEVFNMFNDSLYIPSDKTGKMTHTYIDCENSFIVEDYKGDEVEIKTLSGVHLDNCEFTLSISDQYKEFLTNLAQGYIFKGTKYT